MPELRGHTSIPSRLVINRSVRSARTRTSASSSFSIEASRSAAAGESATASASIATTRKSTGFCRMVTTIGPSRIATRNETPAAPPS